MREDTGTVSTPGWQPSDSSLFTMQQICNLITPGVHKQGALPGDAESPGLNLHLQKPADTDKTLLGSHPVPMGTSGIGKASLVLLLCAPISAMRALLPLCSSLEPARSL